ncbi:hypothetical protein EON63_07700 [archaeon]|nr:MAG: hypothetical protein EON63_07700 [archaeon]
MIAMKCMVYGVWYMVYGIWRMVYGVWCMVYFVRSYTFLYHTIENDDGEYIGAYSFCTNCGMHICYSFPTPSPSSSIPSSPHPHMMLCVHVNADCVDKETVQELHITHHYIGDVGTYTPHTHTPTHTKYIFAREHAYAPPLHSSPSYIPYTYTQNDGDAQQSESTEDMYGNVHAHTHRRNTLAPCRVQSSPTPTHTHTHTHIYPPTPSPSLRRSMSDGVCDGDGVSDGDGMYTYTYTNEYDSIHSDDPRTHTTHSPYKGGETSVYAYPSYQRRMSDDGVGVGMSMSMGADVCVCDGDVLTTLHNRLSKHLSKHI